MKTIRIALLVIIVTLSVQPIFAADWPTYRADAARSGYSSENLPEKLTVHWTLHPHNSPQPAWQAPDTRMPFDYAYHAVVSDGLLFYGSSADCAIHALNTSTGDERWLFITDSPVRFAPAIWKQRVYAVSDDGVLYCLSAPDGRLLWSKRGGPDERMILGNDRMVSKWPARGGPVIVDGILYFAAGIWPSEGIYLYALDADTGETVWLNDSSGGIEMDQPHGTARAKSGVSAQGHIAVTDDRLLLPTGRAVPAGFNRSDGAFQYFHLQSNQATGGSSIVAGDEFFFNNGVAFKTAAGEKHLSVKSKATALTPQGIVLSGNGKVGVYKWVETGKYDKKGKLYNFKDLHCVRSSEIEGSDVSLIVAGETIVLSGRNSVTAFDLNTLKEKWTAEVDGIPYGLAVADGRLFVSTDRGSITCFGEPRNSSPAILRAKIDSNPYGKNALYAQAAKSIIEKTGLREGYCLDLGCGDGALAYELAKRTNLTIYAVDSDKSNVEAARERLMKTGLYGTRITVHHADLNSTHYPNYFANLIVSGRSVREGENSVPKEELLRLLRPYGGIACYGSPDDFYIEKRGALDGAENWTHQYADPANTLCSDDRLARGPLSMLWFRDTDQTMPQRHGRGPAPLVCNGRMFVEGTHALRALDAYNGRPLWEYPLENILIEYSQDHLMGTAGTGSNFCVSDDSVYVRRDDYCLRIDAATGEKLDTFKLPYGEKGVWGYIAYNDGTLFGSISDTDHIVKWRYIKGTMGTQYTESSDLFALDAKTGAPKWIFWANDSIRHNTIAIGDGKVYLIDRPIAEIDKIDFDRAKRRGEKIIHPSGRLIALDQTTGKEIWQKRNDIYGTMLALSVEHDALLMTYQSTRFQLDSEAGGRMTAFRASDGERLWDNREKYASRPLINGRTIYAQPSAWDLLTGKKKDFSFARSYGCGTLASAENLLVFRSATLGYRDLQHDNETINYGGIRPGCWINTIPAGGLVLMADAASGCRCSYLIQASAALIAEN